MPILALLSLLPLNMDANCTAHDQLERLQARAITLETQWRAQNSDRLWLLEDARAQVLLERLRQIDQTLGQLDQGDDRPIEQLTTLWRERDATLSALIESGRSGTLAVRI